MAYKGQNHQVKAKKFLGQHFLEDETVAQRIADSISFNGYNNVLEIGPGMGVLTKYLLKKECTLYAIEIDRDSVEFLKNNYLNLAPRIIEEDF
ncbi:MAG: 16S rRNA (adenine(1518)-N(6)/adenine(1519)-N(6))-dimethyltransferase, partial [Bizionia sp.]|nr:16S rRNA (adenine(1518)-N(6)/adenine(1519)-N(6))-dimethyltransferase [Bizionia sp.]